MKRVNDFPLEVLGGKKGPSEPGKTNGAGRKPQPSRRPLTFVERENTLPKRRKLYTAQRTPEV